MQMSVLPAKTQSFAALRDMMLEHGEFMTDVAIAEIVGCKRRDVATERRVVGLGQCKSWTEDPHDFLHERALRERVSRTAKEHELDLAQEAKLHIDRLISRLNRESPVDVCGDPAWIAESPDPEGTLVRHIALMLRSHIHGSPEHQYLDDESKPKQLIDWSTKIDALGRLSGAVSARRAAFILIEIRKPSN